jgi:hypothetical protein
MAFFQLNDVFGYQYANDIKRLWANDNPPADPGVGEVWLDTSVSPNRLKKYTGSTWDIICDMTAGEILTLIKTVDGAGSGLDADLLDSQQSSFYRDASNLNAGTVPLAQIPATLTGKSADQLDGLNSTQFIRSDASDDVSGHTEWQDTYQVRLGSGADLRIYHNGTNSYIDNYTAHMYIRQLSHGSNIYLMAENNSGTMKTLLTLDPDKNLTEGRIARSALVELWRDNTSDETASPYFQSGYINLGASSTHYTVTFDNAYTAVPRVVSSFTNDGMIPSIYNVTTTSFTAKRHPTIPCEMNWIALGKRT